MTEISQQRLIHFIPDEKVTRNFIQMLESVYPNESTYIVYGHTENSDIVSYGQNVYYYNLKSPALKKVVTNLSVYEAVILHSLDSSKVFQRINHNNIIWFVWGADLYEELICQKGYNIYKDYIEQITVRASHSPIGKIPIWMYEFLIGLRDKVHYQRLKKILNKVRYVSSLDCEFELLKEYFPDYEFKHYYSCFYYPIELQIGEKNLGKECHGMNLWIGNSPALNGNHLSVFNIIKNFSKSIKIYTPISYGEERLINYVDNLGRNIIGVNFIPLKTFLPSEQYFNLFLDVNAFVFGHLRQCALGNVMMAMYFGGKVFLYKDNPLFQQLRNFGFVVFSIEDDLNELATQTKLSSNERAINRKIVLSICGIEAIQKQMSIAFSTSSLIGL